MDLNNLIIKPADFNIGGQRVSNAELDFSEIDVETLSYAGACHILIMLQNQKKLVAAKKAGEKAGSKYEAAIKAIVAELSGKKIDMSAFAPKASWDWTKGPSSKLPPVEKAQAEIKKITSQEDLLKLQKDVEAQLKALKS